MGEALHEIKPSD